MTGRQLDGRDSILGSVGRGARNKRGRGEMEGGEPGLLASYT